MKQRIYIDTSVVGGCLDKEFMEDSRALFEKFKSGEMVAVISEVTLNELVGAPEEVRALLAELPEDSIEPVDVTPDAEYLAKAYLAAGAVSEKHKVDALHIAVATVQRVQVLVSWNFKEIVNLQRIRVYNSVNVREGHPMIEIRSPKEILNAQD